jgi:hypothetical protein
MQLTARDVPVLGHRGRSLIASRSKKPWEEQSVFSCVGRFQRASTTRQSVSRYRTNAPKPVCITCRGVRHLRALRSLPLRGEAIVTFGDGDEVIEAQPQIWIHMPAELKHSIQARLPVVMLLLLLN